jgi:hypothetical protein
MYIGDFTRRLAVSLWYIEDAVDSMQDCTNMLFIRRHTINTEAHVHQSSSAKPSKGSQVAVKLKRNMYVNSIDYFYKRETQSTELLTGILALG